MTIPHPVVIYNAGSNSEAHLLRNHLEQNNIEAYVAEENPLIGGWLFGLLPQIHRPQVWVDRSMVDSARPLLEQYERQQRDGRLTSESDVVDSVDVEVICEECGKPSTFPGSLRDTIQDCPFCSAYLDVGEPVVTEE